jgi:tRNA pseudouridine55 synthase
MPTGVLPVDKPSGPTSHDVVQLVRRLTGQRRCGHTGTLDPFATGLLLLCLGRATRLARFLTSQKKTYLATLRFGIATDTFDCTGEPVGEPGVFESTPEELERLLRRFAGRRHQHPPPFSAKRIGGKRAHRLARAGQLVALDPVEVEIEAIELLGMEGSAARIRTTVSSGTYVRALAHDIGQELGCGAHLEALRRTQIGTLTLEGALGLDAIERLATQGSLHEHVVPPVEALRDLASLHVDREDAHRLGHGRSLPWDTNLDVGTSYRVLGPSGELVAVAGLDEATGNLKPVVVWAPVG